MVEYRVITWNFSTDRVEYYDIMPYLYRRLEEKELALAKEKARKEKEKADSIKRPYSGKAEGVY